MQIQELNPHPLKKEVEKSRLRLYELRQVTGVNEPKLSRMLAGIVPMPVEVEKKLREVLAEYKRPQATVK